MKRKFEISEDLYLRIAHLLPKNGGKGGQWNDHRRTLNGIFFILETGVTWREMPESYGSWKSIYDRYKRWKADGTIDKIVTELELKLDSDGYLDI